MGVKPSRSMPAQASAGRLGSWHANLIYIDGRKTVLFANDRTLFNFIAPDVSRAQVRDLGAVFVHWLSCVLSDEGFGESKKERILGEYKEVLYAPSSDRHVLGSMNELAFHYKYSVLDGGGVHSPEVPDIIRKLNRIPFAATGYRFPIELLRDLYRTAG